MTHSNPTTLSVDEQIDIDKRVRDINARFFADVFNNHYSMIEASVTSDKKERQKLARPINKAFKQNTKSILDLVREVCEEVIGQDDVYDETSCYDSGHYSGRQDLRDEQRTKLNKILGEK